MLVPKLYLEIFQSDLKPCISLPTIIRTVRSLSENKSNSSQSDWNFRLRLMFMSANQQTWGHIEIFQTILVITCAFRHICKHIVRLVLACFIHIHECDDTLLHINMALCRIGESPLWTNSNISKVLGKTHLFVASFS